ncbi:MAG: hypothetical protein J7L38_03190 [Thermoproteales archaeon]|nr:hypothetical protein [Thermoproteales archaeon]
MNKYRLVALTIIALIFISFIPLVYPKTNLVPLWLRKGVYAVYRFKGPFDMMFMNYTWIWFESPIGAGSYFSWKVTEIDGEWATIEVNLHIEFSNTKVRIIRNFNLKDAERKVFESGSIDLRSTVTVNMYTRKVYLKDAVIGETGFWIPPSFLYNGSIIRVGEILGHINVRGILKGPYMVKVGAGWVYAYGYEEDESDNQTINVVTVVLKEVVPGKIYGNLKVLNLTYYPNRNVTVVWLQNIKEPWRLTGVGKRGNWTKMVTDFGFIKDVSFRENTIHSKYYYDPTSGLAIKASFGPGGDRKPSQMASGDGLTVALGLRIFNADIELVKTNIPTLMFEILWRGIIGAGALMALLITSKIKRRRKNKENIKYT